MRIDNGFQIGGKLVNKLWYALEEHTGYKGYRHDRDLISEPFPKQFYIPV